MERGATRRDLARSVAAGSVVRLRKGVYGCAHLDESVREAGRLGGAVTCVSVLRLSRVWAGHDDRLHVVVPPTSSPPVASDETRYHWTSSRYGFASPAMVSPAEALWQGIHCLPEEDAIAALESAIHEGFLSVDEVMRVAGAAPARLADGIRRLVTNSGSGNETIVRLRLQRAGFHVESQPFVPGMGHEDLLVEDCVGVDVDGRRWHGEDRFAIDRDRDIHVEGLGRRALRLRPAHVHVTWSHTLAVIERVVADAKRERRRRIGRLIVRAEDPL